MNVDVLENLILGLTLGLSAGFSPGPILALIISESLTGGFKDGLKVASAPLITDGPIIVLCVLVLSAFSDSDPVLGMVALAGGLYLVKLGIGSIKARPPGEEDRQGPGSLKKAVIANFLNPNPYLFWLTVGSPLLVAASGTLSASAFLIGFYACLVGSKIGIAAAAARSRSFIRGRGYRIVLIILGSALIVFAVLFVKKGLALLDVLS